VIKDETRIIVNDLYGASSKEKVYFELSLTKQQPGTTFYLGELTDGKYLNESLVPIPEYEKGKARYTLFRNQSSVQGHLLPFSASYQTSNSNYRIVTKTSKLAPAGY